MKSWVKVLLGLGAGAAIGVGAAFLGKKRNNEDDGEWIEVCDAETSDSNSDDETE